MVVPFSQLTPPISSTQCTHLHAACHANFPTNAFGIIDANGDLISRELPPDILPESDTTLASGSVK